jgi:hypothetical protein
MFSDKSALTKVIKIKYSAIAYWGKKKRDPWIGNTQYFIYFIFHSFKKHVTKTKSTNTKTKYGIY